MVTDALGSLLFGVMWKGTEWALRDWRHEPAVTMSSIEFHPEHFSLISKEF